MGKLDTIIRSELRAKLKITNLPKKKLYLDGDDRAKTEIKVK